MLKTTNLRKKLARLGLGLVLLAASLGMPAQPAYAAPGDLDPTFAGFGTGGTVITGGAFSCACGMALQPDGKIVMAGSTPGISLLVLRYLPNGRLDTTFDDDGRAAISSQQYVVRATSVAIQADGKTVVAGWTGTGDFLLIRLTTVGELDTTFSGDGFVTTDFSGDTDAAYAVLVQPGGMIVAGGRARMGGDYDFAAARYLPNGSLDMTFGGDGKATIGFGGDEYADDIALQDDGKLVLVGGEDNTVSSPLDEDFEVARLNSDGTLDTSFDGDGKLETGFGNSIYERGKAVAIQPDGKIVVAGDDVGDVLVARYHPNGALDDSFDGDGQRSIGSLSGGIWDAALQPDGKTLLLGTHESPDGDFKFAFYRINPNGSLDTTFDGDGNAFIDFGGNDSGRDVALQADGRILASGMSGANHALVHLWPDGTFDAGGQQTLGFQDAYYGPGSDETAYGMALQGDGKIIVAGELANASGSLRNFALARFLPDGLPDTSFGEQGRVSFGFGNEVARAVAIQPDGKIVAAGYSSPGSDIDFMIARFNADGTKDNTFGFFGYNVVDFQGGEDYGNALALAPDGKIVVAGEVWNGSDLVWGVARFNTNGTLDTTFDGDGKQTYDWAPASWANAVVVQPDRKVVVAGYVYNTAIGNVDFALVSFREDGSRDYGFGPGGQGATITDMGGNDYLNALAITPGGWFYAVGERSVNGSSDFAVAQFMPNGVLASCSQFPCTSWPTGKAFADWGESEQAYAVDVRSDGQIVASGCGPLGFAWAQFPPPSRFGFTPVPLKGTTDFVGTGECALGVKFVGSNQIVVVGNQEFNGDRNFALARFETTVNPNAPVFQVFLPLVMH